MFKRIKEVYRTLVNLAKLAEMTVSEKYKFGVQEGLRQARIIQSDEEYIKARKIAIQLRAERIDANIHDVNRYRGPKFVWLTAPFSKR